MVWRMFKNMWLISVHAVAAMGLTFARCVYSAEYDQHHIVAMLKQGIEAILLPIGIMTGMLVSVFLPWRA